MLVFVSCVVQAVHLLFMNLACGGPLLSWWWNRRDRNSEDQADESPAKLIMILSLWALFGGMITGGVLFFFPRSADFWQAINRFPNGTYWFAGVELIFSVVCLSILLFWWQKLSQRSWLVGLLALVTSSNLLYHFPPLLFVIGRLATDPVWVDDATIDRAQFIRLMWVPEIASLTLHFVFASLAVSGVVGIVLMTRKRREEFSEEDKRFIRSAGFYALVPTLLQIPIGVWIIIALPSAERNSLLGGDLLASTTFLASLMTTVYLLQSLTKISLGEFTRQDCKRVVWLLNAIVFLMTTTLYLSRSQI